MGLSREVAKALIIDSAAGWDRQGAVFRCKKTTKVKALNAARAKIEIFRVINDYLEKYIDFPTLDLLKITYEDDDSCFMKKKGDNVRLHY